MRLFSVIFKHCAFRFFELERGVFIFSNEAIIKATALRRHHLYVTIYMTWMKLIIIEAIPYFTILTLNIAIIRQILSSSSFRRRFTRKQTTKEVRIQLFRALEQEGAQLDNGPERENGVKLKAQFQKFNRSAT